MLEHWIYAAVRGVSIILLHQAHDNLISISLNPTHCSAPFLSRQPHAGGAGGWSRPSGLFAVLLTVLPSLKAALVEPLRPDVAASEPEMALSCLALLEAGVRCGGVLRWQ